MIEDELLKKLRVDGRRLARRFGLSLKAIDPESSRVKTRFGSCREDGTIRIRLRRRNGRPMSYRWLLLTLCHELAHLRFMDHSYAFHLLYRMILMETQIEGSVRQLDDEGPARAAIGLAARKAKRRRRACP